MWARQIADRLTRRTSIRLNAHKSLSGRPDIYYGDKFDNENEAKESFRITII